MSKQGLSARLYAPNQTLIMVNGRLPQGILSRGAVRPRSARSFVPPKTEGAGKAGCPKHPQPVCIGSKHTVVTTSTPEITRLSPRNGFNGFLRALLGDEFLFVTVASWITICPSPVGPTHLHEA